MYHLAKQASVNLCAKSLSGVRNRTVRTSRTIIFSEFRGAGENLGGSRVDCPKVFAYLCHITLISPTLWP